MQTILYVMYDNISLHSITQSLSFLLGIISHELFLSFVVARIHFV